MTVAPLLFIKYAFNFSLVTHFITAFSVAGISFYTFKGISFIIDTYRKEEFQKINFFDYSLYLIYFPQLLSGPIDRFDSFNQGKNSALLSIDLVIDSLVLCLFGYFSKIMIADNIAVIINKIFLNYSEYSSFSLLLSIILYSMQIYFDFLGYSNIVSGISLLYGIKCPLNFDCPYLSKNIKEFWNRWHISLSSWLKDYIYIPLGGNRKGILRKCINLFIVFLVSGIWHGSTLRYIIWGGIHGLWQVVFLFISQIGKCKIKSRFLEKVSHYGGMLVTFLGVSFLWLFFRSELSLSDIIGLIVKTLSFSSEGINIIDTLSVSTTRFGVLVLSILFMSLVDIYKYKKNISLYNAAKSMWNINLFYSYLIIIIMIMVIFIFGFYGSGYDANQFVYFKF